MDKLRYFINIWLPEHTLCKLFSHKWEGRPGSESCSRCGMERRQEEGKDA